MMKDAKYSSMLFLLLFWDVFFSPVSCIFFLCKQSDNLSQMMHRVDQLFIHKARHRHGPNSLCYSEHQLTLAHQICSVILQHILEIPLRLLKIRTGNPKLTCAAKQILKISSYAIGQLWSQYESRCTELIFVLKCCWLRSQIWE